MSANISKLAASSYTAGFGDLGAVDISQAQGVITLGASGSATVEITVTPPKRQAVGLVRLKFPGITFNSFDSWWWTAPQNVVLINGAPSGQITMRVRRSNSGVTISIVYAAGSSGFTFPAHTILGRVHFYQLPF